MSDRIRRKVARFVYNPSVSSNPYLFGPQSVPFLDILKENTVYCNVNLWIQFVTKNSSIIVFPNMESQESHFCAFSLFIRSSRNKVCYMISICDFSSSINLLKTNHTVMYFRTPNS